MSLGFANAGSRAGRREGSLRPIPGQPGLFVSVGGSYRPADLGAALSGRAVGFLAIGVVGLVALAAYINRDQYANPFER
ncbi:MAG: hypothetical protein HC882_00425 [Acidobacteria bacterium]|nr:hypothetical protein [Acidobacteriota bacterium]